MPKTKDAAPEVNPDVEIDFHGDTFTIPRDPDDWPTTAYIARINATTTGRIVDWMTFVELLLGVRQWDRLTTTTQTRDFKQFLDTFTTVVKEECGL